MFRGHERVGNWERYRMGGKESGREEEKEGGGTGIDMENKNKKRTKIKK